MTSARSFLRFSEGSLTGAKNEAQDRAGQSRAARGRGFVCACDIRAWVQTSLVPRTTSCYIHDDSLGTLLGLRRRQGGYIKQEWVCIASETRLQSRKRLGITSAPNPRTRHGSMLSSRFQCPRVVLIGELFIQTSQGVVLTLSACMRPSFWSSLQLVRFGSNAVSRSTSAPM